MKLTALDLYEKGIVEKVIPEPECFTRDNLTEVTRILDAKIDEILAVYGSMPEAELLDHRYMRFREM